MSSDSTIGEKEQLLRMIEQLQLEKAQAVQATARVVEELQLARTHHEEQLRALSAKSTASAPPPHAPPPHAPPAVPGFATPLASPTDGGAASLLGDGAYWGLVDAPLSFDASGAAASYARVAAAARAAAAEAAAKAATASPPGGAPEQELMAETSFYELAVSALPAHIRAGAAQASALSVFGAGALRTSRWVFSGACKPELATAAAAAGGAQPAFVGELKSVDRLMLGQALYYAVMAMAGAFFPAARGGAEPGARVFYAAPPLALALLAFPHVGYFVAVEMVGMVLVSPASRPFFLGSAEHAAAVAALPAAPRGAPAWTFDAAAPWQAAPGSAPAPPAVAWAICASDGKFRKLVRADARSAARWAQMHAAYARLGEIWDAGEPVPAALVRGARLLFGAHEALVEMDAVAGREATHDEATGGVADGVADGAVLAAVAEAVAWLAARRLLYTDVRGPNVLVVGSGGGGVARLIDYDDCIVVPEAVRSAHAYREALAAVEAARAELRGPLCVGLPSFAARLLAGDLPHFDAALARAFSRLP